MLSAVAMHAMQSAAVPIMFPIAPAPAWTVKTNMFSALSVGVSFENDTVGYSSFSSGGAMQLVKSIDGGTSFKPVAGSPNIALVMGVGSVPGKTEIASTGMFSSTYSTDGDTFEKSSGAPFISQSIQVYPDGRALLAGADSVFSSSDGGKTYKKAAHIPFASPGTGRYASAPKPDVIYISAGKWPTSAHASPERHQLTSRYSIGTYDFGAAGKTSRMEVHPPVAATANGAGYSAEIWKSVDGGKSWLSVFNSTGEFYFNEINCFDERNCIAVGEGFGNDGSTSPGARVYVTNDGETFTKTFQGVDGSGMMAAHMLSATDHHAGGRGNGWVTQHSTNGGLTYSPGGVNIKGNSVTNFGFVSATHAYATTINQLQVCSLLEFK